MNSHTRSRGNTRGIIGTIALIVVAIILLKIWFGFDIFKWLDTPQIKGFLIKMWNIILYIWNHYVKELWNSLLALIKNK